MSAVFTCQEQAGRGHWLIAHNFHEALESHAEKIPELASCRNEIDPFSAFQQGVKLTVSGTAPLVGVA